MARKFANTWKFETDVRGWERCALCSRDIAPAPNYWRVRFIRVCVGCYESFWNRPVAQNG